MVNYFDVLLLYIRMNHHLLMTQIDTEGVVRKSLNGF